LVARLILLFSYYRGEITTGPYFPLTVRVKLPLLIHLKRQFCIVHIQWLPKFPALFCTPFLVKIAGNLGNLRKKLFWASFFGDFLPENANFTAF